jgi:ubiquinol-cytochrome c reductase iron-sulfur subunit
VRPGEERRAEVRAAFAFGVCAAGGIALAVLYWRGGQPQLEGLFLAIALGGLCVGFVTWGEHLMPQGPFTGAREEPLHETGERTAITDDIDVVLSRRRLLTGSLGAALVALFAAALFPIRSLGPKPGDALLRTPWREGLKLVTEDGRPVRVADVPVGGLVTVFPEGSPGSADGQAVLVRVEPELIRPMRGREDWSPEGFLAYSKICTHAGCPVGLYQAQAHELLCPCHQSSFAVLDQARPVFGPAAAPLPQLPLRIDGAFLVARGDFSEPVGPSFWRRT